MEAGNGTEEDGRGEQGGRNEFEMGREWGISIKERKQGGGGDVKKINSGDGPFSLPFNFLVPPFPLSVFLQFLNLLAIHQGMGWKFHTLLTASDTQSHIPVLL
jgi:hypothetical protein